MCRIGEMERWVIRGEKQGEESAVKRGEMRERIENEKGRGGRKW